MRIALVPGKPKGMKWLFCNLCGEQVLIAARSEHEATEKHATRERRWSIQVVLDRVIPVVYDDKHYGLFESDAARLGI